MPNILSGKRDIYLEIAEKYERYIRLGVLKDGDKLPSVRTAAGELKVNPNTVQRAYAHLETLGLICSLPKKGVFVTYNDEIADDITDERRYKALKAVNELCDSGITKDELISVIEEVYEK